MDKLVGLISNIELSIRYLLSGVAICAIFLLSRCKPYPYIDWLSKQPVLALFIIGSIGFTAYSLYRIVFWVFGDGAAWLLRLSAPALERGKSKYFYHKPYANFILWRRKSGFDEKLDGYLNYRWAVVHFTFIIIITLCFALRYREAGSIIEAWQKLFFIFCGFWGAIALWQASFLFRLEKELFALFQNYEAQQEKL